MENKNIKDSSNITYNKAFRQYGDDTKSVLWGNQQRQYLRFTELVKYIDMNDSSKELLDIGCGTADLFKYLNFNGYRGNYKGYDINENLIELARKKYDNINVEVVDIMEADSVNAFDYILMSGIFNSNMGQDIDWVKKFVKKMFSMCRNHIAFNALSSLVNYKDKSMFYIDPFEMTKYCCEVLSKRVTLFHHHLPYNYTIVVFKDENLNTVIEPTK